MGNDPQAVADALRTRDRFLIISHVKPDGDALGASFALLGGLLENGKSAALFLGDSIPANYRFFQPERGVIVGEAFPRQADFSTCVCLDASNPDRVDLPEGVELDLLPKPLINVDHHPDNVRFGDLNLIDSTAAATAEIMFSVMKTARWRLSEATATRLLLGLIMDTGCFRFDNTAPTNLEAAAELLRLGADHHLIVERMFCSKPPSLLQLEADLAANHLRTACDGRFAWLRLSNELLEKHGVDIKDTEGLIELARCLNGAVVGGLLYPKDGGYKISLRSKDPAFSVAKVARILAGGGHELAAGGFVAGESFEQAETIIVDHVESLLDGTGP